MKLIIDIDEEIYQHIKDRTEDSRDESSAMQAIGRGIVLPEGHGDLVDRDTIVVEEDVYFQNYIIHAPTIIPADKGE